MKPLIGGQNQQPPRDFGLLRSRSIKIRPAEANVIKDNYDTIQMYNRRSNEDLLKIISRGNIKEIRELSRLFFIQSGIYGRAVRYLADMYHFDFLIYPNLDLDDDLKEAEQKKILKRFNEVLEFFDASDIQLMMRKWAIEVCLNGAYYGYICDDTGNKLVVQDLPIDYCRSRFNFKGLPLVEFNAKYFEDVTRDPEMRNKILSLFPDEFQKGWRKYEDGKLQKETQQDEDGWFVLDTKYAFKFNFNDSDYPPLINAIPSIINLGETQDLAKEELVQRLQKILIQKFALDSNGQIPFTMTELQQLNQNALDMIDSTVGVAVLSTIADVQLEDISTNGGETQSAVDAAENNVYNDLGIAMNLFNTDGSVALEKSTQVDEGFVKPLLLEFEAFLNRFIEDKFNKSKMKFRLKMLHTTIFNYEDLATTYQNLTKIGFSRFLPVVCLGHTQKEVISMAKLEQQIMDLDTYMLPPFSSNTMSSDTWQQVKQVQSQAMKGGVDPASVDMQTGDVKTTKEDIGVTDKGGRPELPDDKKSDKTLANIASKG